MLEPIGTRILHQEVQRRLRAYILENRLGPGDRLPPEMGIARQLKVSRNVVREALRALEALGLVEIRKGSGTHISRFDAAKYLDHYTYSLIVDGIDIDEMWEVRRALELAFVGNAAQCMSDADIREVDTLLAEMERAVIAGTSTLISGLRIHQVIYRGLKNHVLGGLINAIAEFYERVWGPLREPYAPETLARDVMLHRGLVEALHRRDGVAARAVLEVELNSGAPSKMIELYRKGG
jgi:DNA-binding FadR family transcriptional regulator